jgi:hypothetical protein
VGKVFEDRQFDAIRRARGLLARYDGAALRPPAAVGPLPGSAGPMLDSLRLWCLAPPAAGSALAIAMLQGEDAAGLSHLATRLCLERDGSLQLEACSSAAARGRLRLATKLREALWWRTPQPQDPWDSGFLRQGAVGLQALGRFEPRRATLIVAEGMAPADLQLAVLRLEELARRQPLPLRLLVMGRCADGLPPGLAITTFRHGPATA